MRSKCTDKCTYKRGSVVGLLVAATFLLKMYLTFSKIVINNLHCALLTSYAYLLAFSDRTRSTGLLLIMAHLH